MSDTLRIGDRLLISAAFAASVLEALGNGRPPDVVRLEAIHDWPEGKVLEVERVDE